MSFAVRRLDGQDATAYQAVRLEALRAEPTSFGGTYEEDANLPVTHFADYLDRYFCFGAFDAAGLCATANFYVETATKTRHRGHVVGVYAEPRVRGQGAATAVMTRLIEAARNEVKQLHLVVTQQNGRALRFYERLGFVIYGEDPRGLCVGDRYYDDYLMVLRLD